ncbi:MAG: dihydrofolate reductase [Salaquimonas sp.]|nr:dihydrofolate reductase [Salaquimonas sp.]
MPCEPVCGALNRKNWTLDIALVVAIAENGIIGIDGGLPWRLPSDMRHFRAITMGKPVIMGRKTWESIGKPLAGRSNIVISRTPDFSADGVLTSDSLGGAIALARTCEIAPGVAAEICVIGGGQIYAEALTIADRLYVTYVLAKPEGDTLFPAIEEVHWEPVMRETVAAGENDSADMLFVTYERRR